MFSDPKNNRTHREDIPDEEVHLRAAEDILADHSTKIFAQKFSELAAKISEIRAPIKYPALSAGAITDILVSLDGAVLGEWELVIAGIEVDLAVSSIGDQKISRAKGESPLEPGVSITICADAEIPDNLYLFAQGDQGDIVLPESNHSLGRPLVIGFSPLKPDQDYRLRIVRISDDATDTE